VVSAADGLRTPVEAFAPVRPDAVVELRLDGAPSRHGDLLVVRDSSDRVSSLERYDHLLSGWWRVVPRYARGGAPPAVVVLCADESTAIDCALSADRVLCATLARIGVDPHEWERPGRSGICFASERELHGGSLAAWKLPLCPPALRDSSPPALERVSLVAGGTPAHATVAAQPPWR
jgi:hypothetical protein